MAHTSYTELATQQIKAAANAVIAIKPKDADEKMYQEGVQAAIDAIEKGKAHLLPEAMAKLAENERLSKSLEVDHSTMDYFFSILVDDLQLIDIRVPSYNYPPKYTRERALQLCQEGAKHLPAFVKDMGKKFTYGVRLHTRGRWYVIAGLNVHEETRLRNLDFESGLLKRAVR